MYRLAMPKKTIAAPPAARELLTTWLTDQRRTTGYTITKFCREVDVTARAVWCWRNGNLIPSFPNRHRIESVTKGAVPATAWQS